MKAALALIFCACFAGSMAQNIQSQLFDTLLQQGQGVVQGVVGQLQNAVNNAIQQALGGLTSLLGGLGGRLNINLGDLLGSVQPTIDNLFQGLLLQLTNSLGSIFGRGDLNLGSIFGDFLSQLQGQVTQIGQSLLNQGIGAVLGSLGGLGGSSRGIGDLFAGLSQQISSAVTAAQGALQGALGGLQSIGSGLLDTSKPHWEQLQEQLVGHGLNVLGSISETVNNLHGSITSGGR